MNKPTGYNDRSAPFRIQGWRNTQMSIARFYGGLTAYGRRYLIDPATDDLVRDDILRIDTQKAKQKAREEKLASEHRQRGLI